MIGGGASRRFFLGLICMVASRKTFLGETDLNFQMVQISPLSGGTLGAINSSLVGRSGSDFDQYFVPKSAIIYPRSVGFSAFFRADFRL